MYNKQRRDPHL